MHATHRAFLAGLAQEGEDRGEYQDRFHAFAQQDQQRREEADGFAQRVAAQCLGGIRQFRLGQLQLLRRLRFRQAVAQRLAVGHELLLGGLAQVGIDVVEGAFHQLEAFQVGRHGQVVGLVVVARAVDGEALVQGRGGVVDQLRRTALLQRRMGTQGTEALGSRIAVTLGDFRRGLGGQRGQRVGMGLVGFRLGRAEAGDVGSHVPALTLVELVGEGRHVGAGNAQHDHVAQVVEAQMVKTRTVGKIGRRRLQTDAGRTVALAGVAVADRALLRVDRRSAGRVGSDRRSLHHLIDVSDARLQMACLVGDRFPGLTLLDGLAQLGAGLLQLGAFGTGRQGKDQRLQVADEFQLFLVLSRIDDLPVRHGRRVVGGEIAEQVQGLGGVDNRVGKSSETENADKGQQPDEKFGGAHSGRKMRMEEIQLSPRISGDAR
ncbi:hypothetical protein D3C78_838450 [compost metagenome]